MPCGLETTISWDDGEQAKIGTLDFCYNANKSLVVKYPDGTAFE
jgi:hypothetical protein